MKTIVLFALCIIFLYGCGDKLTSPPTSVESKVYFPLETGNIWHYSEKGFIWDDTLIVTVSNSKIFNRKTYYEVKREYIVKDIKPAIDYYRTENNKVYLYRVNKDSLYIDFVNKDTTVGYVYSTADNVVTKVGTFDKVKNVGWPASAFDGAPVNSYAPNVGLISSVGEGPSYELIYAKLGDKIYK
ncbi:MAG: hypothetical protein HYZ54_11295 [Ignavibacteriae bacterium]|nr:hypothetical protein [Ignavibacteriota bacterium]